MKLRRYIREHRIRLVHAYDPTAVFVAPIARALRVPAVLSSTLGNRDLLDRRTRREYEYGERMSHRVCLAVRRRGILLRPLGNVVVLMPPLSLTVDEARHLGAAVREAIFEVTGP